MSKEGLPATMVVGGKTFNLAGLINESVLDLQMANVFKVLKKLSSLIDTQTGQIQALQTKVLEIDPLAQRISSMHAWQETTADRLNRIEEKLVVEAKEIAAVSARVTSLEDRFGVIAIVQQEMKDTNDKMDKVSKNFDQLKLDARDALLLSKEVKLFKTELQELQEDVTTVLHQAPATERLISQVQQNVEASTEQLMAMSSKTAFMEATMSKMSETVSEFKFMKDDLTRRLTALENPKIDRLGVLETQSRSMAKQVGVLQHNWMTNWGAHEQSMQLLKDEMMLHINQLRLQEGGGPGEGAGGGKDGSITFIRMDEEEKAALRKQIDQCHRDINRIDNKKADYVMVMKILDEKADAAALETKMDAADAERRLKEVQGVVDNWLAQQPVGRRSSVLGRTSSSASVTPASVPLDRISESDPANAREFVAQIDQDEIPAEMVHGQYRDQLPRRPMSTPPVLPSSSAGGLGGAGAAAERRGDFKGKTSVRYTSSGQQVTHEYGGSAIVNRRLSAQDGRHLSGKIHPQSRQSRPPPGRIRPATATGMPGSPPIYLLGANDSGKNKRQALQPDPSFSLTAHSIRPVSGPAGLAGGEDYVQLGNWEVSSAAAGFSPLPRPGLDPSPIPQQQQTSYDVESDSGDHTAGN